MKIIAVDGVTILVPGKVFPTLASRNQLRLREEKPSGSLQGRFRPWHIILCISNFYPNIGSKSKENFDLCNKVEGKNIE